MDFGPEILEEFVIESREHFENIEDELLRLSEQESPDRELVDKIFRSIHSVKGAAGFLALDNIGKLSHVMETLLSMLRAGQVKPERYLIDALLAGVDILNTMMGDIGKSNEISISDIYNRLTALIKGAEGSKIRDDLKTNIRLQNIGDHGTEFEIRRLTLKNLPSDHKFLYLLKYDLVQWSKTRGKSPVTLIRELLNTGQIMSSKIEASSRDLSEGLPIGPLMYFILYSTGLGPNFISDTFEISEDDIILIDKGKLLNTDTDSVDISDMILPKAWETEGDENEGEREHVQLSVAKDEKQRTPDNRQQSPDSRQQVTDSKPQTDERYDLRVDLEKLDLLINLVGELVIAESMVTNSPDLAGLELENFDRSSQNLRRIITDLQDTVLSMRMVPLSKTFRKTIRLVHDLSNRMGKECKVKLIGEETEVDKTVIEHITDPLLHIIRNCMDHAIESPGERETAGKPRAGNITIEAKHEGGEVLIRISDDGRGLDSEKILAKAVRMHLIKGDESNYSDQDIFRLIFEPGFSTAEKLSEVSGRGVGLDVVRRNIETLKGKTDIQSVPGKGTSILLRIPLTLAIIDGMLVRVGSASYTIPMLSIRESFRPNPAQITVTMDGQEVVRVREDMIPVVRLHQLYNIVPEQTELDQGILISIESGSKSICLFADEIMGHHQTVIKRMPGYVSSARGVSGCTILGNGDVSLILDVGDIIDIAEKYECLE